MAAFFFCAASVVAGPFPPAAGQPGSTAVHFASPGLLFWADGLSSFTPGPEGDDFDDPTEALGAPSGDTLDDVFDVVSLGRGGEITLTFPRCIADGDGPDFAVFENAITDNFLELGFVEVSGDGVNFIRLPNRSLTAGPVPPFGGIDPTDIDGLAGKYRVGYGTPFDLADAGLSFATHVRIMDIVGDGNTFDSLGSAIYDPYPTEFSAGFDLDAVGVLNDATTFSSWQFANFDAAQLADPLISGPNADPDLDLLANLAEYAFDFDPLKSEDRSALPATDRVGTCFVMIFDRFSLKTDLIYHLDASLDCASWREIARSMGGSPMVSVDGAAGMIVEKICAPHSFSVHIFENLDPESSPMRFFRVRISML